MSHCVYMHDAFIDKNWLKIAEQLRVNPANKWAAEFTCTIPLLKIVDSKSLFCNDVTCTHLMLGIFFKWAEHFSLISFIQICDWILWMKLQL